MWLVMFCWSGAEFVLFELSFCWGSFFRGVFRGLGIYFLLGLFNVFFGFGLVGMFIL